MGVRARVSIIEDDRKVGIDTYIIKKDDLYSA